jgi:hypothetical protein
MRGLDGARGRGTALALVFGLMLLAPRLAMLAMRGSPSIMPGAVQVPFSARRKALHLLVLVLGSEKGR